MEQIASDGRRTFFLRVMQPGDALDPPFGGEAYPVLLWATGRTTAAQKQRLAEALIASNCRYVVCGGRESGAWEEAADAAFTAREMTEAALDALLVMTTSHERESPDDVAFFFANNTSFGPHDFARYLVLMIGEDERVRRALVTSLREETGEAE